MDQHTHTHRHKHTDIHTHTHTHRHTLTHTHTHWHTHTHTHTHTPFEDVHYGKLQPEIFFALCQKKKRLLNFWKRLDFAKKFAKLCQKAEREREKKNFYLFFYFGRGGAKCSISGSWDAIQAGPNVKVRVDQKPSWEPDVPRFLTHQCRGIQKNKNPQTCVNPLVPEMQNLKIRQFIIDCLPTVCFVKRPVCLDAHYSERQGLMG